MAGIVDITLAAAMEAKANDPANFITRQVAPVLPPEQASPAAIEGKTGFSAKYFKRQVQGFGRTSLPVKIAPGGETPIIPVGLSDADIFVPLRSAGVLVNREIADSMTKYGIQSFEGDLADPAAASNVMLDIEKDFVTKIATGSYWANSATGGSTTGFVEQWDNPGTNVLAQLAKMQAAIQKAGKRANTLVLGWAALYALRNNANFAKFGGDATMGFTTDQISELLSQMLGYNGVKSPIKVFVPTAVSTTDALPTESTSNNAFLNSNFAWFGHVAESPSLRTRSALYTIQPHPWTVRQDQVAANNSYMYTGSVAEDAVVIDNTLGFCLASPVSSAGVTAYGG